MAASSFHGGVSMSYNVKVYRKQSGDELVVADGGKITVEPGGSIDYDGDIFVPVDTQAPIADVDLIAEETYTADQLQGIADTVDSILAALRAVNIIDSGA